MRNNNVNSTAFIPTPRKAVLALSLGVCVVYFVGCKSESGDKTPVVTVQTAVAEQTDLVQTVETEAILYPVDQAAITPKLSAPVRQFYVNRGSRVTKGQLLAVLENRDLSAAAMENRGGLEQAEAAYSSTTRASLPEEWKKAELDAAAAKQMLDAEEKLYSSREELYKQGALPRKELDQAGVNLTQARNQHVVAQQHLDSLHSVAKQDQLKSANAQLTAARGKYLGARAQLSYTDIHSPIDGVVADRPLYAGETAPAGVPFIVIVDASKIIAKAHLSQEQAAVVKVGDAAEIAVPGDNPPVAGKVTVVSPATDPNSTTVEVWVQAANPSGRLRPGSSAHLSIAVAKFPGATAVPAESVVTSEGRAILMVVGKDSIAHQTEVKLGARSGTKVQITEGIKPGETVVASGAYGLPDGAKVQVAAAESAPEKSQKSGEKED
jgi:RND family efflux transporter MFP subunit